MPLIHRLIATGKVASRFISTKRPNNLNRLCLYKQSIRYFASVRKVFNCPEAGEGQTEIDILEWFVKPGDNVKTFDVIGRGKYEKADIDIIAPYAGKIEKLFVDAGSVATIHKPLIEFECESDGSESSAADTQSTQTETESKTESPQSTQTQTQTAQSQSQSQAVIETTDGPILTTPAVRRIAKENNVNLASVPGTGKDGRILKEDILNFIDGKVAPIERIAKPIATPSAAAAGSTPVAKQPVTMTQPASRTAEDYVEKIIGVKRAMVKKMTEANEVPMFGYSDEINMSELVRLRKDLKSLSEKKGVKLSYMPFIIKAVSLALMDYPMLNAHITPNCEELIYRGSHNIGVAVDSPEGLIVPNIKDCNTKSILEIANDLNSLIQRARDSQVTNSDITGGTFTLSNIGAIGGTYCRPICFVPEVCIGALGAFQMLPRYDSKMQLNPTPVMAASWSADHRVIDGATVARFSNEWKNYLENPAAMLLHLH